MSINLRARIGVGAVLTIAWGMACSQARQVRVEDAARQKYVAGDYDGAVKILQEAKGEAFQSRDRVAYWMNVGMLMHDGGKYDESTKLLQQAAVAADQLYTTSISSEAASLGSNQTVTDYEGENFERVLLHVVSALNYAEAGDLENARVEAVKTNEKLKYFRTQGGDQPPVFSQDAFADWLTGIIYEMQGDANDALISYKSAAAAYQDVYGKYFQMPPPLFLGEDIVRAARKAGAGFEEDVQRAKQTFPGADGKTFGLMKDHGELLLLHACGEAPIKRDFFLQCGQHGHEKPGCDYSVGDSGFERSPSFVAAGELRKVAMPIFEVRRHVIDRVRVSDGEQSVESVAVEPIAEIAVKDLNDRLRRTFVKAVGRALAKATVEKAARSGIGQILKGVNSYNEEADKRSWHTLPSSFNVARMWLAPGEHELALDFLDGAGNVVRHKSVHATVAAGKRVIVTVPSVD